MKKIISLLLSLLLATAALTAVSAAAEEEKPTSGTTGDCTWEFDPETGELTIDGNGAMADYPPYKEWLPIWFQLYENDITSVVIGDGVTHIGNASFKLLWRVDAVHLGKSVKTIGSDAFIYCPITTVVIPDGCESIGDFAFHDCELEEAVIPDTVTYIGTNAFYYNLFLHKLTLSKNVEYIGDRAFGNCYIRTLDIPDTVTYIGDRAFISNRISHLTIGKNVQTIGERAFLGLETEELVIPDSVQRIGDCAFVACDRITEVTIPAGVTAIGAHAFGYYYPDGDIAPLDSFTVSGCVGSAAQTYAVKNGFDFVDVTPAPTLSGDADGSGGVDVSDVTAIQHHIAESAFLNTAEALANADANRDGFLDIADATIIQMYIAEYITAFPA